MFYSFVSTENETRVRWRPAFSRSQRVGGELGDSRSSRECEALVLVHSWCPPNAGNPPDSPSMSLMDDRLFALSGKVGRRPFAAGRDQIAHKGFLK